MTTDTWSVLVSACRVAGVSIEGAELLRESENALYRLRGHTVARVSRLGQIDTAVKEVQVSRWLAATGVAVVEALDDIEQPVEVEGRAVTFWRELPEHRYSTHVELAQVLRDLHRLPPPSFALPAADPFVRLEQRLTETRSPTPDDREWLLQRVVETRRRYDELPAGLPHCAVHGDAWAGNIVVTASGPIVLDLERFAFGPPEWDLSGPAVDFTTFGYLSRQEWHEFCDAYGHDVTSWSGFEVLRDARELRKVTFAYQLAGERHDIAEEASYRLACLRGERGPRPWHWAGIP